MGVRFRILMVEYFPADADLVLRELKRAGVRCAAHRVETLDEYRRELEDFRPHVIFSDVAVPGFDGMEALAIARQTHPDIPFIFISGTPGEEYAVRALKNGATDLPRKCLIHFHQFSICRQRYY